MPFARDSAGHRSWPTATACGRSSKHLDRLSPEEIARSISRPGIPLLYGLDDALSPVAHRYLGDPDAVQRAMQKIVRTREG